MKRREGSGRAARPPRNGAGRARRPAAGRARRRKSEVWRLRLYIAGQTARAAAAVANLKTICEKHLEGRYALEVVDLLETPQLARGDQILAIPTLVRRLPPPMKKIIGDLSNEERVLVGLDLQPR